MKKLLLVAFLAVFMLGIVACGGSSPEDLSKNMIKVTDEYTAALKKVASKEDLISAMKAYNSAVTPIFKGMKDLSKDPEAAGKMMQNKELQAKVMTSMQNMMKAQLDKNVMKFMVDPEAQKISQDLQKTMSMK